MDFQDVVMFYFIISVCNIPSQLFYVTQ